MSTTTVFNAILAVVLLGRLAAAQIPERDPDIGTEYDGVSLPATGAVVSTTAPAILIVDPTRILAPGDARLLGINQTWVGADRIYRGDALRAALGDLRLPLNRMGGIDSQSVRWRDLIRPSAQRPAVTDPFDPRQTIQTRIGLVEWIRTCLAIDPEAGFSWTFNCMLEEPEDHAALAEFLTGDAMRSALAVQRAASGLPDPVRIEMWEIGNELDWKKSTRVRFPTADSYADYCARTMAAVRAVQPGARFAAFAATGPWDYERRGLGDWRAWHRSVLTRLGADLDYLAFHPYYEGLPIRSVERYLDVLRDDCAAVPGGHLRLYLSEHGVWPPELRNRATWTRTHDLAGCLSVGAFIVRMANRPEIGALALHGLSDGPWGMIYPRRDGGLWCTGLVPLFHLLQDWRHGPVLAVRLEDAAAVGDALPLVVAVRGDAEEIQVLAVNRLDAPRRLAWRAPGAWRRMGAAVLSGPTLDAVNSADTDPIAISHVEGGGMMDELLLPARSLSLIGLRRQQ